MQHGLRPEASNFGLQLLFILAVCFNPIWGIITLALLIFKATYLPFPPTALGFEIAGAVGVYICEVLGVHFGKRGNLTEHVTALALGLGLLLVASAGQLYFMYFQTYVMMLDLGLSATFLGMNGFCVIVGLVTLQNISAAGAPASILAGKSGAVPPGAVKHD